MAPKGNPKHGTRRGKGRNAPLAKQVQQAAGTPEWQSMDRANRAFRRLFGRKRRSS